MTITIPYYEDMSRVSNSYIGYFKKSPKLFRDSLDGKIKSDPTKNIGHTIGWVKTICHTCAVGSGRDTRWKKRKSALHRKYINFKYSFSYRRRKAIENFFSKLKTFFD